MKKLTGVWRSGVAERHKGGDSFWKGAVHEGTKRSGRLRRAWERYIFPWTFPRSENSSRGVQLEVKACDKEGSGRKRVLGK